VTEELLAGDEAAAGQLAAGGPEMDPISFTDPLAKIGDVAAGAGIRRVDMVAWRDLDHPEAGGSELHAASIAERWAAAGIDVRLTASRADGAARTGFRDGYRVERPAGRYGIFPFVAAQRGLAHHVRSRLGGPGARAASPADPRREQPGHRPDRPDATVEIWNGMPFFSPLWADRPRLVFLHHVHDRMWDLVLPPGLAAVGRLLESRVAPPVYRRTPVVTLSESSRRAIVDLLGFDPSRVHVVAPGVDEAFCPGPGRHERPLVVAVGRLVPYKRFDRLIDVLVRLRSAHPGLEAVIAGEGQERGPLEEQVRRCGAQAWISLPGRIDDEQLVELYQRAWVLASTSAYEGWGLTISEAAACGTPAVASPIAGHSDAIEDGVTGFLAQPGAEMEARIGSLLSNPLLRRRMQRAAHRRAATLTWDRTALETMRLLAAQA
jgi:glycosyltransferase involved in cell wall biosynthesis